MYTSVGADVSRAHPLMQPSFSWSYAIATFYQLLKLEKKLVLNPAMITLLCALTASTMQLALNVTYITIVTKSDPSFQGVFECECARACVLCVCTRVPLYPTRPVTLILPHHTQHSTNLEDRSWERQLRPRASPCLRSLSCGAFSHSRTKP